MGRNNHSMATFQRCSHYRDRAGLSQSDLLAVLENKPSKASLVRLEGGMAIRKSSAFRVANGINAELKRQGLDGFDADSEVKPSEQDLGQNRA